MSYGIEVRTTNGLEDVKDLRSAQIVVNISASSTSGTVSIPVSLGVSDNTCCAIAQVLDGAAAPWIEIGTNQVSWDPAPFSTPSSSFLIIVLRIK